MISLHGAVQGAVGELKGWVGGLLSVTKIILDENSHLALACAVQQIRSLSTVFHLLAPAGLGQEYQSQCDSMPQLVRQRVSRALIDLQLVS